MLSKQKESGEFWNRDRGRGLAGGGSDHKVKRSDRLATPFIPLVMYVSEFISNIYRTD